MVGNRGEKENDAGSQSDAKPALSSPTISYGRKVAPFRETGHSLAMKYRALLAATLVACMAGVASGVDEYEQPPIQYSQSIPVPWVDEYARPLS